MPDRLDFKQLAQDIDIADVASLLRLEPHKDRFSCPTCDNERAIQLYRETNTFRCHIAKLSGDCITLYAHAHSYTGQYRAAKELSEHFQTAKAAGSPTAPQKPAVRSQPNAPSKAKPAAPKKETVFDAAAFAAKLSFTPEVAALGYTEDFAAAFSIGFYKGCVYTPVRYPSGSIAGFEGYDPKTGKIKLPKTWLPDAAPNVVPFQKRA
jgi:hypothetical protein